MPEAPRRGQTVLLSPYPDVHQRYWRLAARCSCNRAMKPWKSEW